MTTDNPIAKHLKEYHCGELRVVPSRELEAAFQIRGPDLRRTINCLRGDGIPICSSDSGYYYADTEEELRRTIRQLRSRIKKIAYAERGLTKALEQFTDSGQICCLHQAAGRGTHPRPARDCPLCGHRLLQLYRQ